MRKIKHYLEYSGVLFLSLLVSLFSLEVARTIGRLLGKFVFSILRIRRNVSLQNLERAFPEKSASELRNIARRSYEHFGMVMFEYLRITSSSHKDIHDSIVSVKGIEILEEAHRAGKGAIFITAHFGNWEYAGGWLGYRKYPMTVMVQRQSNPYVDTFFRKCRERIGMHTIQKGKAIRSYLKTLRSGHYAVMLADQDAGEDGVFVDFFNQPASTATGPARFHLQTGAPILLFMTYRDATHNLHMEIAKLPLPVDTDDKQKAAYQIMLAYNQSIEKWIRQYPHHWFWMHKRWKTMR